jgi:DNA-binding CsgD family transcriptional regulator
VPRTITTLWYQGLVLTARGALAAAADALEEALATEQVYGTLAGAAPFVANFAVLAVAVGQPEASARLVATAAGVLERRGMVFDLPERLEYDRALAETRRQLREEAFGAAWDTGWARTIEESAADIAAVLTAAKPQADGATKPDAAGRHGLTGRELEILRLVAAGRSNREIADALFISVPTVKSHLTSILGKLDLPSRSAATAYAHTHHLA